MSGIDFQPPDREESEATTDSLPPHPPEWASYLPASATPAPLRPTLDAPADDWEPIDEPEVSGSAREQVTGAATAPFPAAEELQDEIMVLSVEEREIQIEPGDTGVIHATLLNNGRNAAQFFLQVEGTLQESWVAIEPTHTQLRPGERMTFILTIAPPRGAASRAGTSAIYISARSPNYPQRRARARVVLAMGAYHAFALGELHPAKLRSSWHAPAATTLLPVTNQSNLDAQICLEGSDGAAHADIGPGHRRARACRIDFMLPGTTMPHRDRVIIALSAGQTLHIPVRITPRRRDWFGISRRQLPFRITGWVACPASAPTAPVINPDNAPNAPDTTPSSASSSPEEQPVWSAARTVNGRLICIPLIGPGPLTTVVGCGLLAALTTGIVAFMLLLALFIPNMREQPPVATPPPVLPAELEIVVKIAEPVPAADDIAIDARGAEYAPAAQAVPAVTNPDQAQPAPAQELVLSADGVPIVQPDMVTAPGEPSSAVSDQSGVSVVDPTPVVVGGAPAASAPGAARGEATTMTYEQMFRTVAANYNLDWRLLAALAYVESGFNPVALGSQGDLGLMQVMPATWQEWAPQVAATDPFDSYSNVQVAAAYLDYLRTFLSERGYSDIEWALVAYNWGPTQLQDFLNAGRTWDELEAQQRKYANDITGIAASLPTQ